jgi:hypothetical protein
MVRAMKRGILLCLLVLPALSGCKSSCVELAGKICDCQATQTDRDNCNTAESSRASSINPTAEEEATCAALVDSCQCHELNTAAGKMACGLARPAPDSGP